MFGRVTITLGIGPHSSYYWKVEVAGLLNAKIWQHSSTKTRQHYITLFMTCWILCSATSCMSDRICVTIGMMLLIIKICRCYTFAAFGISRGLHLIKMHYPSYCFCLIACLHNIFDLDIYSTTQSVSLFLWLAELCLCGSHWNVLLVKRG